MKSIGSLFFIYFLLSTNISVYSKHNKQLIYSEKRKEIVNTAKRYLGVKYRYGGTTPFGFDCSGFVMFVFNKNGYTLPRGTSGQYKAGKRINIKYAKPGDLVFFTTRRRRISHVGIYIGNNNFIHSPSRGKRVSIANLSNLYWRRRFIGAVSLIKKPKQGEVFAVKKDKAINLFSFR